MKKTPTIVRQISLLFTFLFLSFLNSSTAQVTSSSVSGLVKDAKESLMGASVVAIHQPTGTKYGVVTDLDGRYSLENMLPGGPYKLTVTFVGYRTEEKGDLTLTLGANTVFNFTLLEASLSLDVVNIVGNKLQSEGINNGKNISQEQMRALPTLSRSLTDMTKLSPQNNNNSFAGTNFRYNNVTVDGAVNNDAIGFSPSLGGQTNSSGMPGSSTRTNPISLDAIQDIQVYVAPYDVKIGNFTGGSINAVTRSGTNDFIGSVYGFGRNGSLVGKNNAGDKSNLSNDYYDYQTGFRVGFPIIKNKLFFFTNFETTKRQEPIGYKAGEKSSDGTPLSILDEATAQRLSDTLKSRYGFDAGGFGAYNIYSKSTKLFTRADWNISEKTTLSIRNNYIISEATNLERDAANFRFGSMDFTQNNVNNSTVLELKSRITNKLNNSLIVGLTDIHDYRNPLSTNASFPQTEIAANGGTIFFGNDREATVFNLRQKTLEITDNLTFSQGKHRFLIGTHNELYSIDYGFVNSWNGRVAYSSLDNFYKGQAARARGSYSFTDNTRDNLFNTPYAQFNVNMLSVYGQDEIHLNDNMTVTLGLRFDRASLGSNPAISTQAKNAVTDPNYGTTYNYTPLSQITNNIFGNVTFSDVRGRMNCTTNNGRVRGNSATGSAVTIRDSFGNIELDTISGTLDAETSNGKVTVRDARGSVTLKSSFGTIEASNIPKGIRAITGNGGITLTDVGGDTFAKTSLGSVLTERINGNLTVENTNGSVTARNVKGDAIVNTSFAGVTLESIGGRIHVDNQNGAISVTAMRSAGGCRDISLKTSFSSIRVRVPEGVGYNLTARTSFGRISSDLPVTSTGSVGGDTLSGAIGAGGCQLQLTDSNGSIEIAKAP